LVWVRFVHFASIVSVAGALVFSIYIAEPAFRIVEHGGRIPVIIRTWLAWIEWSGLAVAILSGAAWLVLKAAQMGDVPWKAVFSEGLVSEVLSGTGFGQDWVVRSILAVLLAAVLFGIRPIRAPRRFSTLGIVSVGTLVATGIINTWAILGSLTALVGTDYGRRLLVKVALFIAMLSLAAINRLRLTPLLQQKLDVAIARTALHRIRTNSVVEAGVGFIVVVIVGLLGTMSPNE
jgi:putative copper resistance protein D